MTSVSEKMHLGGYTLVGSNRSSDDLLLTEKFSVFYIQTSCRDSLTKIFLLSTPNIVHYFFSPSSKWPHWSKTQLLEKGKHDTAAHATCSSGRNLCGCWLPEKHPHSFLPGWSRDDPAERPAERGLPAHVEAAWQHLHVFLPLQGLDVHPKKGMPRGSQKPARSQDRCNLV